MERRQSIEPFRGPRVTSDTVVQPPEDIESLNIMTIVLHPLRTISKALEGFGAGMGLETMTKHPSGNNEDSLQN